MLLGEYIKESRTKQKISQRELAKRVGTSNTFISNLEKGTMSFPKPGLLQKIALELGLDYIYLMQMAGILPQKLVKQESALYRFEKRDEWIQNQSHFESLILDYKLLSVEFDAYIEKADNEIVLLKIITELVNPDVLLQEIKILALDILISKKEENIELNIIYPVKQIREIELQNYLDIEQELLYIPIKIKVEYK